MKGFILGSGGLGREILDIYVDLGREEDIIGFLDENPEREGAIVNGKEVKHISILDNWDKEKPFIVVAIGSTKRKRIIDELKDKGYKFDTPIHPNAIYSKWVSIGEGTIITAGVIATNQITIGDHVIVNLGAHIGHDSSIGDYTTLSPGAEVMGNVSVGKSVYVGVNAAILEGISIGDGAIIAAGAVVTKDVPDMAMVAGVPAQVKKIYESIDEKPW